MNVYQLTGSLGDAWCGLLAAINVNKLAGSMGDACYGFLAMNFLWGLFCVILLWRRIRILRFPSEQAQREFLLGLEADLDRAEYAEAEKRCGEAVEALPQLTRAVIENRDLDDLQLRQLVAELMQRNILADLEYRVSWVATVIKSGPLLGLFGTVLGMMAAFGRIGTGEKVQPYEIAGEIAIALICTAMGLMTAIPFTYFLAAMNIRIRMLQDSLTSGLTQFLEHFENLPDRVRKAMKGERDAWNQPAGARS
jgi:biopolymer transport protein ExbB